MHGVAVEGVEAVAETAQRDGVQGEPGHVRGDIDRFARIQPLPLLHQLRRDVVHHRHVVPHRLLAEVGQQMLWAFDQFGSSVSEVNNPALRPKLRTAF